ncbi:MAG: UPF0149 family protein [Burkholderiaceae bacterium]|nr:UPF0149 family protein [Burkholderiaceae bacterium]
MATDPRLRPLGDAERDQLEALLDALPPPLDPLDLSALDGFLVGVLLQPRTIAADRWLRLVTDTDGRPAPPGPLLHRLQALVQRRHAELDRAITARQWFDPWVFELDADEHGAPPLPSQVVLPWVAGFSAALEAFPALLQIDDAALREPLAVLYAHFDPEDLDDADDLRDLIDDIAPPDSVAEAVEDLVRCTLLLADISRPRKRA